MELPVTQYLRRLFSQYEQNRRSGRESVWRDNYAMFRREFVDRTKAFKESEALEPWQCDARLGTTRQKVIAGVAIVLDTLLQGGQVNYMLELDEWSREQLKQQGAPTSALDDEVEAMKSRIDSYLAWGHADRQLSRHALSAAVYGITYSLISIDEHVRRHWVPDPATVDPERPDLLRWVQDIAVDEFPKWSWKSVWDIFTDLENPDLQQNAGTFVRWFATASELGDMTASADPTVIGQTIRDQLNELSELASESAAVSPEVSADEQGGMSPKYDKLEVTRSNIRMLDFYGRIPASRLDEFLRDASTPDAVRELFEGYVPEFEVDQFFDPMVEIVCTLMGKDFHIIRLAPGDAVLGRPISKAVWEESLEGFDDVGIVENCKDTQHLLDGIFRTMIDNQKFSSAITFGMKEEYLLEPVKSLKPGQKIPLDPNCPSVRDAIQQLVVTDISGPLLQAFSQVHMLLEEDSAIPRIQQGQESARMETAFSMSQRMGNSGKYFARVVSNFDEGLIEPNITWMYNYAMALPEPIAGRGGYDVTPLGFSSFQNRVVRLNGLLQFLNVALAHPEVYQSLKMHDIFGELAKMLDLDPTQMVPSNEEMREREAAQAEESQRQREQQERASNAAIGRDESLARINNVSAQVQAEKVRLEELKALQEIQQGKPQ